MSVLWIEGEAGIGKSRLLSTFMDQCIGDPYEGEGISLHVRLYPNSEASPGWLIANALQAHRSACSLFTEAVRPDLDSAINALRRLTRLRPTVLILDDLHWLSEKSAEEFARLLHSLREQPLAIICSSRPGQHPGYMAAAGFLAQTLHLAPLDSKALLDILHKIAVPSPDNSTAELLQTASHGIPLLLPGLIRELMATQEEERNHAGILQNDTWKTQAEEQHAGEEPLGWRYEGYNTDTLPVRITNISRLSKESLIAGLPGTMNEEEREAAIALSVLGEVFTEEAAILTLGEHRKHILYALHEQHIIVHPLKPISPLLGRTAQTIETWTFTHSLLHEIFFSQRTGWNNQYVVILQSQNLTLYSLTLLLSVLDGLEHRPFGEEEKRCLQQTLGITYKLLYESHVLAATQLFDRVIDVYNKLEGTDQAELKLQIAQIRINLASICPFSQECHQAIQDALDLTANPQTIDMAKERLQVLVYKAPSTRSEVFHNVASRLAEISTLTEQFPSLLHSKYLTVLLGMIAGQLRMQPYSNHIQTLTQYAETLHTALLESSQDAEGQTDAERQQHNRERNNVQLFTAALLPLFTNTEEYQNCYKLAERVTRWFHGNLPQQLQHCYVRFLINSGEIIEAQSYLNRLPSGYGRILATSYNLHFQKIFTDAVLGAPLPVLETHLQKILHRSSQKFNAPANAEELSFPEIGTALCALNIGRMLGEEEWARTFVERITNNDPRILEHYMVDSLARYTANSQEYFQIEYQVPEVLSSLLQSATCREFNAAFFQAEAKALLSSPIVHIDQIFMLIVAVAILEEHSNPNTQERYSDIFHSEIRSKLSSTLQWCLKKNLVGYIPRLLKKASGYLTQREANRVAQQYTALKQELAEKYGWQSPQIQENRKTVLTMIGTIAVERQEQSKQRIQGSKARRTLGLMVASELMRYRLSLEDFRTIATGINLKQGDPANALRQVVSRLRSVLGKEAIIADGQSPPRLNLDVVSVDVIQIWKELEKVSKYVRNHQPGNARQSMIAVLKMIGSEPVYPALYGEFFESVRNDFEVHLRNSVLAVVHALNHEEDYEAATALLNLAYEQLPNDEEIAEELLTLLQRLERNTEEFWIRQRIAKESENGETKAM